MCTDHTYLWRRGDGVVAGLQAWQQLAQMVQRRLAGRQVLEDVNYVSVVLDDPLIVQRLPLWIRTCHQTKFLLLLNIQECKQNFTQNGFQTHIKLQAQFNKKDFKIKAKTTMGLY